MSTQVVAGRYRILREVGRGGMATVYLAEDEKHQRQVALKALRPHLVAEVGPDRFLREIEITAGLNHPHILPLLDSGTEDGLLYYVMPYVGGGSLRRLLDAGSVPLQAVVRIAREVAAALDHAHARGVIHRDIKPENILFNDGLAVVSDFGIARAMSGIAGRVTGTGLAVGTLGYMSPEQALASDTLDPRTDVYSLGCVLYELITGGTPTSWPGAEDVELGRFESLPEDHRRRLERCPGRVQQVLVRALALRPQHRFDSAGEMAAALAAASEQTAPFSDEQVRRLLERAAELQAEAEARNPGPGALTIGGVEQIAAQVGIPPAHVRDAARELRAPEAGSGSDVPSARVAARMEKGLLGGDWRRLRADWNRLVTTETVIGSVPDDAFPAMVAEIQRAIGTVGHASTVGGTLTWTPVDRSEDARRLFVQVTARATETEIRVQEDLGIWGIRKIALVVGGVFGAAFGGTLGQAFAMGEGASILVLLFAAAGVLAAVRSVVAIDASERAPALQQLVESLARIARDTPGRDPASQPGPRPAELPEPPAAR